MATKKTTKKKVVKKKEKTARIKGKAQIVYFPGDKLPVLEKLLKKAKGSGVSKVVIESLEKTL